MDCIHTRLDTALADPTFWPAAGGVILAASALEGWLRVAFIVLGIVGCIVKSSTPKEP
ncbi:MAG: hypothetical protein WCJ64_08435 [Rhodospirillaceae bacterium]